MNVNQSKNQLVESSTQNQVLVVWEETQLSDILVSAKRWSTSLLKVGPYTRRIFYKNIPSHAVLALIIGSTLYLKWTV